MNEVNNEYSCTIQEGWNMIPYSILMYYSGDIIDTESFIDIVNDWLSLINNTENTRLDIRLAISDDFDISLINEIYSGYDLVVREIWNSRTIIFWYNLWERKLSEDKLLETKDFVKIKIDKALNFIENEGWFEVYAINTLNNTESRWLQFENLNFQIEEVYNLWWINFGWTREEVQVFIENSSERMFWLRNSNWILISLLMIWNDYETTEWSVEQNYQWQWIIEPLLILVNWIYILNWLWENIFAHLRYNRSIWPWIKFWLRVQNNYSTQNILTNYVNIEWNMEHFVEGVLDKSLYTKYLLNKISKFIT